MSTLAQGRYVPRAIVAQSLKCYLEHHAQMTPKLMCTNVFVDWVMHGTICQKRGKLITLQEPVPKTKNTSESIHVGATLNNHGVWTWFTCTWYRSSNFKMLTIHHPSRVSWTLTNLHFQNSFMFSFELFQVYLFIFCPPYYTNQNLPRYLTPLNKRIYLLCLYEVRQQQLHVHIQNMTKLHKVATGLNKDILPA